MKFKKAMRGKESNEVFDLSEIEESEEEDGADGEEEEEEEGGKREESEEDKDEEDDEDEEEEHGEDEGEEMNEDDTDQTLAAQEAHSRAPRAEEAGRKSKQSGSQPPPLEKQQAANCAGSAPAAAATRPSAVAAAAGATHAVNEQGKHVGRGLEKSRDDVEKKGKAKKVKKVAQRRVRVKTLGEEDGRGRSRKAFLGNRMEGAVKVKNRGGEEGDGVATKEEIAEAFAARSRGGDRSPTGPTPQRKAFGQQRLAPGGPAWRAHKERAVADGGTSAQVCGSATLGAAVAQMEKGAASADASAAAAAAAAAAAGGGGSIGGARSGGGGWTAEQLRFFDMAMSVVPPTLNNFWPEIARLVPGKSAADCFHLHAGSSPLPAQPRRTKPAAAGHRKADKKFAASTAGAGTAAVDVDGVGGSAGGGGGGGGKIPKTLPALNVAATRAMREAANRKVARGRDALLSQSDAFDLLAELDEHVDAVLGLGADDGDNDGDDEEDADDQEEQGGALEDHEGMDEGDEDEEGEEEEEEEEDEDDDEQSVEIGSQDTAERGGERPQQAKPHTDTKQARPHKSTQGVAMAPGGVKRGALQGEEKSSLGKTVGSPVGTRDAQRQAKACPPHQPPNLNATAVAAAPVKQHRPAAGAAAAAHQQQSKQNPTAAHASGIETFAVSRGYHEKMQASRSVRFTAVGAEQLPFSPLTTVAPPAAAPGAAPPVTKAAPVAPPPATKAEMRAPPSAAGPAALPAASAAAGTTAAPAAAESSAAAAAMSMRTLEGSVSVMPESLMATPPSARKLAALERCLQRRESNNKVAPGNQSGIANRSALSAGAASAAAAPADAAGAGAGCIEVGAGGAGSGGWAQAQAARLGLVDADKQGEMVLLVLGVSSAAGGFARCSSPEILKPLKDRHRIEAYNEKIIRAGTAPNRHLLPAQQVRFAAQAANQHAGSRNVLQQSRGGAAAAAAAGAGVPLVLQAQQEMKREQLASRSDSLAKAFAALAQKARANEKSARWRLAGVPHAGGGAREEDDCEESDDEDEEEEDDGELLGGGDECGGVQ